MDLSALLLSRVQFAFTVSFHIIFPSFTIGLAAWLTVLEALHLVTGRSVYRILFEFWLKIFGIAFGLGVVSGIVMAFEFGTNWSELSRVSGPIQGPLLTYETFTAFALEASFFGVLLFGRQRVSPGFYLLATAMVALGTTFSAFWIMVNNSWMQAPVGYAVENGVFVPTSWSQIIFSPVVWVRFPHMLLASLFLFLVFGFALVENPRIMNRWLERPYLLVFSALGVAAAYLLAGSIRRRSDRPTHIGRRHPVAVGAVDIKATLQALLPRLQQYED